MKQNAPIAIDALRRIIRLDTETGRLYWLTRPQELFASTGSGGAAGAAARWNANFAGKEAFTATHEGYRRSRLFRENYYAHVLVWALAHGKWPESPLDHINGDKSDNRPANLREVPHDENCRNQPLRRNNRSGVMGVTWNARQQRWVARINADGARVFLGMFETLEEAIAARREAEVRFGYHANHGRPGAV